MFLMLFLKNREAKRGEREKCRKEERMEGMEEGKKAERGEREGGSQQHTQQCGSWPAVLPALH